MKTMPLSEAKAQLSKLVDGIVTRAEQVTITRNGRPAAIMVSPDEFESWQETIEIMQDRESMASIRRALEDLKHGRTISGEELAELFGEAPSPPRRRQVGKPKTARPRRVRR